jgi:DNA-binding MarR family transcriptional regulator
MSRIVDAMVASGWAERRSDPADHRACVIGITSAGAALIDTVRQDNATRLAECVSRLAECVSRLAECVSRLDPADLAVLQAALPVLESLAQQVACRAGTGPRAEAATLA